MKKQRRGQFWTVALSAVLFCLLFLNGPVEARLVGQAEARTAAARLLEIENGRPDLRLTPGSFELDRVEPLPTSPRSPPRCSSPTREMPNG
jgi:hypothetical protein